MTTVYDVPAEPLIERAAKKLKETKAVSTPEWAAFVRTGAHTEKPPEHPDWWFVRSAAVLRKIYLQGPIGTERLAAEFGGKRDRGSSPYHAVKGSRKVIRAILQQLQESGLVENVDGAKGRRVTSKGMSLLDNAAHDIRKDIEAKVPELAKY